MIHRRRCQDRRPDPFAKDMDEESIIQLWKMAFELTLPFIGSKFSTLKLRRSENLGIEQAKADEMHVIHE